MNILERFARYPTIRLPCGYIFKPDLMHYKIAEDFVRYQVAFLVGESYISFCVDEEDIHNLRLYRHLRKTVAKNFKKFEES